MVPFLTFQNYNFPLKIKQSHLIDDNACNNATFSAVAMNDEKIEKRRGSALAFFDRRHSANAFAGGGGVRRSASSVGDIFGSRRNSTPIQTVNGGPDPGSDPPTPSLPPSNPGNVGRSTSFKSANAVFNQRQIRAEKWQHLAKKVLGNLDEEEPEGLATCGNVHKSDFENKQYRRCFIKTNLSSQNVTK
jgi:hypothetical protein